MMASQQNLGKVLQNKLFYTRLVLNSTNNNNRTFNFILTQIFLLGHTDIFQNQMLKV